jgi:hypothetical protein
MSDGMDWSNPRISDHHVAVTSSTLDALSRIGRLYLPAYISEVPPESYDAHVKYVADKASAILNVFEGMVPVDAIAVLCVAIAWLDQDRTDTFAAWDRIDAVLDGILKSKANFLE